jgi:hypothetical protein
VARPVATCRRHRTRLPYRVGAKHYNSVRLHNSLNYRPHEPNAILLEMSRSPYFGVIVIVFSLLCLMDGGVDKK